MCDNPFEYGLNNTQKVHSIPDAITAENSPTTSLRNANWVPNLSVVTIAKVRTTLLQHAPLEPTGNNNIKNPQNKDPQKGKTVKVLQVLEIHMAPPLTLLRNLRENNSRNSLMPVVFIGRGFTRCQHIKYTISVLSYLFLASYCKYFIYWALCDRFCKIYLYNDFLDLF